MQKYYLKFINIGTLIHLDQVLHTIGINWLPLDLD